MAGKADAAFGELLRRCRKAAGLTQEELAARAGLSARGIADLERGARRSPRRDTLEQLVRALGASSDDEAALFDAARRRLAHVDRPGALSGTAQGVPRDRVHHNLPAQLTPLLGRNEVVRTVVALVRRADVRLVTLTGPGGVGKTRLAIQVAAELLDDFADGVWFVRLAHLTDPALVLPTIAETLGLKEAGGQSLAEQLPRHLRERRLLLVLDNFEHVAAAAPEVVDLLQACPALHVLTTSRAALRVQGEHEYPVAPLAVPPTVHRSGSDVAGLSEQLKDYPAVALFVERARAVRPDFALTAANAPAVAAICAQLDGLPLAIELAAVRVTVLPPGSLLAHLERGLNVLARAARDQVARQQTLRNALAWSEQLLSAEERVLFRRLAVFAGGWTLEAAEAVCAAPAGAAPLEMDALDGLGALVDQSLVQQREEGGEPRFSMLHVIREYALERLEAAGLAEAEGLRRAHAGWLLALAERAEPELVGPAAAAWLRRLEREHDNLRAALSWTQQRAEIEMGSRLVAAVWRFWESRGHLREGLAWVEGLLTLPPAASSPSEDRTTLASARARVLLAAGRLATWQGDYAAAERWLERTMAQGRLGGDLRTTAFALNALGVIADGQNEPGRAETLFEEALALMREVGDKQGTAVVMGNLGGVALLQGNVARAETCTAEALTLSREVGDGKNTVVCLGQLGTVALRRGEIAHAEALRREALALCRELDDPARYAEALEDLVTTAGLMGQAERAARLLGAAATLRDVLGAPQPRWQRAELEEGLTAAHAALGEPAWAAAFAAGRVLSLEQAIAEALG